jgi:hypothetical protein
MRRACARDSWSEFIEVHDFLERARLTVPMDMGYAIDRRLHTFAHGALRTRFARPQIELLGRFQSEGLACRALIS